MKKLILCASLSCMAMMFSCQREELVPADEKPEWLGSTIYEELQSGKHLEGTFTNYLQLVRDLGYDEVLGRTGSKTIFPANDAAFEAFFQSDNAFGVHSYAELTEGMKKQLLYTSMLDNAMLTGMLSNVSADDNNVSRGIALKHASNLSITDTIYTLFSGATMPQGNSYWRNYYQKGINVIYDGTVPMIVHFTREQMLNNAITVTGVDCDFGILRGENVGASVDDSQSTYVFGNKVVKGDVTCMNGYIHQVDKVIVPPGNVGQVLRSEKNTKLFSRMLDYHCAPYYNAQATNSYNSWALQNGRVVLDSIFEVRYFSKKSHGTGGTTLDPNGSSTTNKQLLWDPGWNQYTSSAVTLADMGAILVPTDEVMQKYFCAGGDGAFFVENYGKKGLPNTPENLPEHLDTMFVKGNGILTTFVNNLMQSSFIESVPSKFDKIQQNASGEFMGLTTADLARKQTAEGEKYDVCVASNGVVYKLNRMIVPDEYQSVLGPAVIFPEYSIMNSFAQDKTNGTSASTWGADLYYYLLAMKSKFTFFLPSNNAFSGCYIDPVSLASTTPRALEFYSHWEANKRGELVEKIGVKVHDYNKATGEISSSVRNTVEDITASSKDYKSQVYDVLQYHTLILDSANVDRFGENHYYLTKHGGAIRLDDFHKSQSGNVITFTGKVRGGAQLDNGAKAANITRGWYPTTGNGYTLALDNVIQPSITSVYALLHKYEDRFSEFLDMISIFDESVLMSWAGIAETAAVGTSPQERYFVFSGKGGCALDQNVNFFNGYNYTFFAPDNKAMEIAYNNDNLPRIADIKAIYEKYQGNEGDYPESEIKAAKAEVQKKLNTLRAFVRYHFMNNSVFADNKVSRNTYQSMYSSELGIPAKITTESTDGILTVTDATGHSIRIDANSTTRLVNKMTRDYEFDARAASAKNISVSSFAVVHQVSEPLRYNP